MDSVERENGEDGDKLDSEVETTKGMEFVMKGRVELISGGW